MKPDASKIKRILSTTKNKKTGSGKARNLKGTHILVIENRVGSR